MKPIEGKRLYLLQIFELFTKGAICKESWYLISNLYINRFADNFETGLSSIKTCTQSTFLAKKPAGAVRSYCFTKILLG